MPRSRLSARDPVRMVRRYKKPMGRLTRGDGLRLAFSVFFTTTVNGARDKLVIVHVVLGEGDQAQTQLDVWIIRRSNLAFGEQALVGEREHVSRWENASG